jgi:hypothetical protein
MTDAKNKPLASEASSVTPPTVAPGLGYPADRVTTSPSPTGWQPLKDQVVKIKPLEVSRASTANGA